MRRHLETLERLLAVPAADLDVALTYACDLVADALRADKVDAFLSEAVARWVGLLAHRAELAEQIAANAVEQGRRAAAEELITVMAHDLRNYIAPLDMRIRLVRRRVEQGERSADKRDLDLALKAISRLGRIVGDMLDVARIEQGVLQIEPQPLALVSLLSPMR